MKNGYKYEDLTGKELDNFIRYVYHEIPEYNQYKGSYKGVKMALNMLGLCCKLVELWSKVDDKQKDDLRRADEISDFFMKRLCHESRICRWCIRLEGVKEAAVIVLTRGSVYTDVE